MVGVCCRNLVVTGCWFLFKMGQKALRSSVRGDAEKSKIIIIIAKKTKQNKTVVVTKVCEESLVQVSSLSSHFSQAVEGSVTQQGAVSHGEKPNLKELQKGTAVFLPSSQCHCTIWEGRGDGNEGVELLLIRQEWWELFYIFCFFKLIMFTPHGN